MSENYVTITEIVGQELPMNIPGMNRIVSKERRQQSKQRMKVKHLRQGQLRKLEKFLLKVGIVMDKG